MTNWSISGWQPHFSGSLAGPIKKHYTNPARQAIHHTFTFIFIFFFEFWWILKAHKSWIAFSGYCNSAAYLHQEKKWFTCALSYALPRLFFNSMGIWSCFGEVAHFWKTTVMPLFKYRACAVSDFDTPTHLKKKKSRLNLLCPTASASTQTPQQPQRVACCDGVWRTKSLRTNMAAGFSYMGRNVWQFLMEK